MPHVRHFALHGSLHRMLQKRKSSSSRFQHVPQPGWRSVRLRRHFRHERDWVPFIFSFSIFSHFLQLSHRFIQLVSSFPHQETKKSQKNRKKWYNCFKKSIFNSSFFSVLPHQKSKKSLENRKKAYLHKKSQYYSIFAFFANSAVNKSPTAFPSIYSIFFHFFRFFLIRKQKKITEK